MTVIQERKIRARFGLHAESTGRRGKLNEARRARTQAQREAQAAELTDLIERIGVQKTDVARLIGCDKSTFVNYLKARRSTPTWVMTSVRALAASPSRARLSSFMTEDEWQALRAEVVVPAGEEIEVELCLYDWPDAPDRLCDEPTDGEDGLCPGHRADVSEVAA